MANTNLKVQITAVDKTQKAFRAVAAGLKAVSRSLFSFKTSILAAVGVGGLGLLIKTSLDSIDKISKMSRLCSNHACTSVAKPEKKRIARQKHHLRGVGGLAKWGLLAHLCCDHRKGVRRP